MPAINPHRIPLFYYWQIEFLINFDCLSFNRISDTMKKEIYTIPGKLVGHHHPEIDAIIDTWTSLMITLDDYKSTIYNIGILDFAPKNRVTTWVIDTSNAAGVFKPEIQEFRQNIVGPKCVEIGIRNFFIVQPQSAIGKLSTRKTTNIYAGQKAMQTFEVSSIDEVLTMLKKLRDS